MNDECASTRFYHLDMQDVAYTCENAQHFFLHHVQYRWEDFHRKLKIAGKKGENIHKAHSGAQGDLSDACTKTAISSTCPSVFAAAICRSAQFCLRQNLDKSCRGVSWHVARLQVLAKTGPANKKRRVDGEGTEAGKAHHNFSLNKLAENAN